MSVSEGQEIVNVDEGIDPATNRPDSLCHDHIYVDMSERTKLKDPSRLAPVNVVE